MPHIFVFYTFQSEISFTFKIVLRQLRLPLSVAWLPSPVTHLLSKTSRGWEPFLDPVLLECKPVPLISFPVDTTSPAPFGALGTVVKSLLSHPTFQPCPGPIPKPLQSVSFASFHSVLLVLLCVKSVRDLGGRWAMRWPAGGMWENKQQRPQEGLLCRVRF